MPNDARIILPETKLDGLAIETEVEVYRPTSIVAVDSNAPVVPLVDPHASERAARDGRVLTMEQLNALNAPAAGPLSYSSGGGVEALFGSHDAQVSGVSVMDVTPTTVAAPAERDRVHVTVEDLGRPVEYVEVETEEQRAWRIRQDKERKEREAREAKEREARERQEAKEREAREREERKALKAREAKERKEREHREKIAAREAKEREERERVLRQNALDAQKAKARQEKAASKPVREPKPKRARREPKPVPVASFDEIVAVRNQAREAVATFDDPVARTKAVERIASVWSDMRRQEDERLGRAYLKRTIEELDRIERFRQERGIRTPARQFGSGPRHLADRGAVGLEVAYETSDAFVDSMAHSSDPFWVPQQSPQHVPESLKPARLPSREELMHASDPTPDEPQPPSRGSSTPWWPKVACATLMFSAGVFLASLMDRDSTQAAEPVRNVMDSDQVLVSDNGMAARIAFAWLDSSCGVAVMLNVLGPHGGDGFDLASLTYSINDTPATLGAPEGCEFASVVAPDEVGSQVVYLTPETPVASVDSVRISQTWQFIEWTADTDGANVIDDDQAADEHAGVDSEVTSEQYTPSPTPSPQQSAMTSPSMQEIDTNLARLGSDPNGRPAKVATSN